MPRSSRFAAALVIALSACGGGSGGSPPQPSPSPSPAAQPTPAPSATPTPSPSNLPTSTPDQGSAPATLRVEQVDADAECAGLVPDGVPDPVAFAVTAPTGAVCLGGTADGTGHVAVGFAVGGVVTWTVHDLDGRRSGQLSERGMDELVRQPEGWHGVAETPLYAPFIAAELVRVTPEGAAGARSKLDAPSGSLPADVRLAGDPSGGSVVAVAVTATAGNHSSRAEAFRFDTAGGVVHGDVGVASGLDPVVSFLGAGVSTLGEAIVTYRQPGALSWRWISRDGRLVAQGSAPQTDVRAGDPVHFEPLLDGSVAASFSGEWTAVIPHLGTSAVAAPAWLAARRGTALRITRGGRGYAVLPPPGEALADCAQVVELRAPSGRLCGRITLQDGAGPCTGRAVEQGWDGTLLQASAREACTSSGCTCTVRGWPKLLARP